MTPRITRHPTHDRQPLLQAQDGKKVLTHYLQRYAKGAGRARAAHLVALPFTSVPADWHAPDCPRDMLLDNSDLPRMADLVRHAIDKHGAGHQPLSPDDLDDPVNSLAAQLVGQTSLLSAAEEHEAGSPPQLDRGTAVAFCLRALASSVNGSEPESPMPPAGVPQSGAHGVPPRQRTIAGCARLPHPPSARPSRAAADPET